MINLIPCRIARVLALGIALAATSVHAQHRLPPVENQDLAAAQQILDRANAILRDAPGFRYEATARHLATPPTAAIASADQRWQFVGGAGKFWSLAPTNLTMSDGQTLSSFQLDSRSYMQAPAPRADEAEEAVEELSWGFGQYWMTDIAIDPSRPVHNQVDYPGFELLGTRAETIDGVRGQWVYMSWVDENTNMPTYCRAWHDDPVGFPMIWEYDNTDDYMPEELGGVLGITVELVVYQVRVTDFEMLEQAPDATLFTFEKDGLELFDDDFGPGMGFGDEQHAMPEVLDLNPDAVSLGKRLGFFAMEPVMMQADLEGDGEPETIAWAGGPRLVAFGPTRRGGDSILLRGIAEDEWGVNSVTPVLAHGRPCFAVEMERYDPTDWSLAEVVLCLFDAEGNEMWRTLADQNLVGAANFTYLESGDLTGDGEPEIVIGRHLISDADWDSGHGLIEVFDTDGSMLARKQVGDSIDGLAVLETAEGTMLVAIVNGSARAVEFDLDRVVDRSGPPTREKPDRQTPAGSDRRSEPIF